MWTYVVLALALAQALDDGGGEDTGFFEFQGPEQQLDAHVKAKAAVQAVEEKLAATIEKADRQAQEMDALIAQLKAKIEAKEAAKAKEEEEVATEEAKEETALELLVDSGFPLEETGPDTAVEDLPESEIEPTPRTN